jgi:hypothetical protein
MVAGLVLVMLALLTAAPAQAAYANTVAGALSLGELSESSSSEATKAFMDVTSAQTRASEAAAPAAQSKTCVTPVELCELPKPALRGTACVCGKAFGRIQ